MKRYVIIGVGGHGEHWCKDVLPRLREMGKAEAVGAVDINRGALERAKGELRLTDGQLFCDAEEALRHARPDFVVIVVPPALHEKMVDVALRHDCHILSEKPIADTMEACCRIYHKVKRAGKKMSVTMTHRFDRDKRTLEHVVKSGNYGPLNYVVYRFTHNCREFGSWGKFRHEIADPLLIEGTVHHFDIMRAITGSNAKTVYAVTWNPPWGEFAGDSTALITLEMESGAKCLYEGAKANASTMNPWLEDYIRAECRDGTLELDRRELRVLRGGAWERPTSEPLPLLDQPTWCNPWLAEEFVDWLDGGRAPQSTVEDNIQCCAILFAAIESARQRKPVDVQAFLQEHLKTATGSAGKPGNGGEFR